MEVWQSQINPGKNTKELSKNDKKVAMCFSIILLNIFIDLYTHQIKKPLSFSMTFRCFYVQISIKSSIQLIQPITVEARRV